MSPITFTSLTERSRLALSLVLATFGAAGFIPYSQASLSITPTESAAKDSESGVSSVEVEPPSRHEGFHFAPELLLSVPQPAMLGVEIQHGHVNLRGFLESGFFQFPVPGSEKTIKAFTLQTGVRYFPWGSWFYTSGSVGYRNLSLGTTALNSFQLDDSVSVTNGSVSVSSFYAGIILGGCFELSKKLSFGFDLGAQIPFAGDGSLKLEDRNTGMNSSNSTLLSTGSADTLSRVAFIIIPQVTLSGSCGSSTELARFLDSYFPHKG